MAYSERARGDHGARERTARGDHGAGVQNTRPNGLQRSLADSHNYPRAKLPRTPLTAAIWPSHPARDPKAAEVISRHKPRAAQQLRRCATNRRRCATVRRHPGTKDRNQRADRAKGPATPLKKTSSRNSPTTQNKCPHRARPQRRQNHHRPKISVQHQHAPCLARRSSKSKRTGYPG